MAGICHSSIEISIEAPSFVLVKLLTISMHFSWYLPIFYILAKMHISIQNWNGTAKWPKSFTYFFSPSLNHAPNIRLAKIPDTSCF